MARRLLAGLAFLAVSTALGAEPTFLGKSLRQWEKLLKEGKGEERIRAATALGIGPFGKKAVPVLIEALTEKDSQIQFPAIRSLGQLGRDAKTALPKLRELLLSSDKALSDEIASCMAAISTEADTLPISADNPKEIGRLARFGHSALPLLKKCLLDEEKRLHAVQVISVMHLRGDEAATVAPSLIEALKDKRVEVRQAILSVLEDMRSAAKDAIPVLLERLDSEEDPVAASRTLAAIGKPAWPSFRKILEEGPETRRRKILELLSPVSDEVLPWVLKFLVDENRDRRRAAADSLWRFAADLGPHLALLREAARDRDTLVRSRVCRALGMMHGEPEVMRLLARGLLDVDLREDVADIVDDLGHEAEAAIPVLLSMFRDGDPKTRVLALQSLVEVSPLSEEAVTAFRDGLRDRNPEVRLATLTVLKRVGSDLRTIQFGKEGTKTEIIVPALLGLLRDPDEKIRGWAATMLCLFGYGTPQSVRLSVSLVGDAQALERSGEAGAVVVPLLIERLKSEDSNERCKAADLLAALGPRAHLAVEPLLRCLEAADDVARDNAAGALLAIGKPVAPQLIEALKRKEVILQRTICDGLRKDTPGLQSVLQFLYRFARDGDHTWEDFLRALERLDVRGEEAIQTWTRALSDPSFDNRMLACRVLLGMGKEARSAIPELKLAMLDDLDIVRATSMKALAVLDPEDKSVLSALEDMLSCRDPKFRIEALEAIGLMKEHSRPLLPRLRAMSKDRDEVTRIGAALASWRITGKTEKALPVIHSVLREASENGKIAAVTALSSMGRDKEYLLTLVRLIEDDDENVRHVAGNMLVDRGKEALQVMPQLMALKKHRNYEVRKQSAWVRFRLNQCLALPRMTDLFWKDLLREP